MEYQGHNIGPRAARLLPIPHAFDADAVRWGILKTPKDLRAWLASIPLGAIVAVDTETNALPQWRADKEAGLNPFRAQVTLIQMSYDGEMIALFSPELLSDEKTLGEFNHVMAHSGIVKVFHNSKFDMKMLAHHFGSTFSNCDCTMVMRKLLTAGLLHSASLKACAFDYLGFDMEKETREEFFRGERTRVEDMTPAMLRYAALDVAATWHIRPILLKYLEIERMTDVYTHIERDLTWVVAQMELEGIGVDIPYLRDTIQPMLEGKIRELQLDVDASLRWLGAGVKKERRVRADEAEFIARGWSHVMDWAPLNVNSAPQVKEALNRLGLELRDAKAATLEQPTYTPESMRAGRLATGKDISAPAHHALVMTLCSKILELKKSLKAVSSFVVPLQGKHIEEATGRIHCSLNQNGAGTGRFTHSDPNLAQMPKPNSEGIFGTTPLRRAFTFPAGTKPIVFDYSACELRILAEVTQDPNLCRNVTLKDPHRDNAILMYPEVDPAEITKESVYRGRAKAGIYLKCYGGGAKRLGATLGIPMEEAAAVLRALSDTFNFAEYETRTKAIAVQKGYAVTLSGRKRYFDIPDRAVMSQWEFRQRIGEIERAALNHPIQGTNADITKLAMVWAAKELERFGGKLVMSIHDELVAWAPEAAAEEAAEAMGNAMLEAERQFLHRVEAGIDGGVKDDWSH